MIEFQSSPGLRAGCYLESGLVCSGLRVVSILTRPSGRVLRFGQAGILK